MIYIYIYIYDISRLRVNVVSDVKIYTRMLIKTNLFFLKNFYKVMSLPLKPTKLNRLMRCNKFTKVRILVTHSTHYWREVSCLTSGLKTQWDLTHIAWSCSSYKCQLRATAEDSPTRTRTAPPFRT